jgi:hypothetical protein
MSRKQKKEVAFALTSSQLLSVFMAADGLCESQDLRVRPRFHWRGRPVLLSGRRQRTYIPISVIGVPNSTAEALQLVGLALRAIEGGAKPNDVFSARNKSKPKNPHDQYGALAYYILRATQPDGEDLDVLNAVRTALPAMSHMLDKNLLRIFRRHRVWCLNWLTARERRAARSVMIGLRRFRLPTPKEVLDLQAHLQRKSAR